MGIKGIYRELGPGQRISLAKLAIEKLESSGRPLRLAIDIAIWQFQTQAARGGTNPAIRTLFYRLVRILSLGIHPIFVFDGPHKPALKRNKRSGRGDGVATAMAKRVIRLFGFPVHDAPGEAEAECALLQQQGIVDAVLSEDVDTIMFGCTRTLRSWTAEGARGAKTPTHVSMYDVNDLLSAGTGLDREGMVLVALMSGGDYIPEGVPGCGVKVACEAAKAGFGTSLCRLKSDNDAQFEEWRNSLRHELRTNQSSFFRVRHKALSIPDEFPNRQALRYYTHPVVSNAATIDRLKAGVNWSRPIDVQGLRYFAEETFDWVNRVGAVKLTRVLSPGLLVHKLLERHMSDRPNEQTTEEMEREELELIKRISAKRSHHSTDGITELRVAHIPADIVGLDLTQELDEVASFDRQGLALNSDDEFEAAIDGDAEAAGNKTRAKSLFDPTVAELIWLPETLVKLSVPLTVEDWEERQRSKALPRASNKAGKKKSNKNAPPEAGALDMWVHTTKIATTKAGATVQDTRLNSDDQLPPLAKPKPRGSSPRKLTSSAAISVSQRPGPLQSQTNRSKQFRSNGKATAAADPTGHKNPWAYAGSQHMPRIIKSQQSAEAIVLSSSPLRASPAPACSSLSPPPPPFIVDLSDPDDAYLFKPSKPPIQPPGTHIRRIDKSQPASGTHPALPTTPPKSMRSMKQMRMDSFIISAPKQTENGDNLPWTKNQNENGSESHTSASQAKTQHSSCLDFKVASSITSHTNRTLTSRVDDDCPAAPKFTTPRRSKKMMPRTSACGFFKVVEMSDEEDHSGPRRQSGVSIIDLTGDDEQ